MGYIIAEDNVDTLDWEYGPIGQITTSENLYTTGISGGGTISLCHDPLPNTNLTLVPFILKYLATNHLKSVTVGECLGDVKANFYRTSESQPATSVSGTFTQPTGVVGPSGSCGGSKNYVCSPGLCCSAFGWCGTGDGFCDAGCLSAFGLCQSTSSTSSSSSSSIKPSSSSSSSSSIKSSSTSSTKTSSSSTMKTTTSSSAAAQKTGTLSPDGSCGGTNKYVCPTLQCCSQFGYCGTGTGYCGTGCQLAFGVC
jgi:hypothetical protein